MNVLMLVFNRIHQGTYWRAYHLARHLVQRGHQVSLIATSRHLRFGVRSYAQDQLTLVEAPDLFQGSLRSGWDPWNTWNRIHWLDDRPFDIVHAFEGRPTVIYPARYAARRQNAPLVMDWCDWFGKGGSVEERPNPVVRAILRPVETYFEEHFRPLADGNTVICSTLQEKAVGLGVPASNLLLLPNGADTERFRPLSRQEARSQTGLPADAFVIGYVGTIFGRDAQLLAQAFDLISGRLPQARLLIAGYCPLDIAAMVQQPQRVIQTGYLSEEKLNQTLSSSDIFWLPLSDSNANRGRFPLKLTDYLAVGRPVIATAVGDIPKIFGDKPIGMLSNPSAASIADQTMQLYARPELRSEMGQNARHLAETKYYWGHLSERLESFYTQILQGFVRTV